MENSSLCDRFPGCVRSEANRRCLRDRVGRVHFQAFLEFFEGVARVAARFQHLSQTDVRVDVKGIEAERLTKRLFRAG